MQSIDLRLGGFGLQPQSDHHCFGDRALIELTQRFDALEVASMADLILPRARLEQALERIRMGDPFG